jgi:hypothetical protein
MDALGSMTTNGLPTRQPFIPRGTSTSPLELVHRTSSLSVGYFLLKKQRTCPRSRQIRDSACSSDNPLIFGVLRSASTHGEKAQQEKVDEAEV